MTADRMETFEMCLFLGQNGLEGRFPLVCQGFSDLGWTWSNLGS